MSETRINPYNSEWNGYYVPKHNAKLIKESIENNTAPFMPNSNGEIVAKPIINANTGYILPGKDLLAVQITKINNGYKSDFVATKTSIDSAKTAIKANEKGVPYNYVIDEKNEKFGHSSYFFPEQVDFPDRLIEFAANNNKQKQKYTQHSLKIESVDEYLPKYFAACKTGAKLEVSSEIAEQFKEKMLDVCNNQLKRTSAEKNMNLSNINEFLFSADLKSTEIIKNMAKSVSVDNKKEQKKEIEISR